jgi:hypothetical protein
MLLMLNGGCFHRETVDGYKVFVYWVNEGVEQVRVSVQTLEEPEPEQYEEYILNQYPGGNLGLGEEFYGPL